jgi:hypothetical protein
MKCKTLTVYDHHEGLTSKGLKDTLNTLSAEGWDEINFERENDETEPHIPLTYAVDAARDECICLEVILGKPKYRKLERDAKKAKMSIDMYLQHLVKCGTPS